MRNIALSFKQDVLRAETQEDRRMCEKEKGGVSFGPPLPLWVRCVWSESLQDAQDIASLRSSC